MLVWPHPSPRIVAQAFRHTLLIPHENTLYQSKVSARLNCHTDGPALRCRPELWRLMQCTFIVVSYILAAGSLYNLCSSNINAHIVSARLQLVFLCSTTHKPSTDSLYAIHLFFMPISIQTERQKEINISIKMIYHSRPQRKLNMLLGQHVSKTKQNILVVTFGKCSILSLSFEFSCFGIITFVVRIVRRIMRSFTSFFDNHICHMFTFAFYCPCGPNTKWVETCQNTDNNRIDLSAKVSCIL